jgi:Mg2+/Co2+ transporter CorC
MGGLFTMQLGYVPESEESIQFRGLTMTAKVVGERRVKELIVQKTLSGVSREGGKQ